MELDDPRKEKFDMLMRGLMGRMMAGNDDNNFKVLGPLSPKDKEEWDAILEDHKKLNHESDLLEAKHMALKARRKMFWALLEEKTGILDKNMRINDGILLVEKDDDEKEKPEAPGDIDPFGEQ